MQLPKFTFFFSRIIAAKCPDLSSPETSTEADLSIVSRQLRDITF